MNNKHNTIRNIQNIRHVANITLLAIGLTLLTGLAGGAQEVAGGGASKDDHTSKGAMRDMSRIKEAGVITVKGDENWNDMLGFGKDSDMAEMMTLMMVGGSGMEHMKMAGMRPGMKIDKKNMKGMAMAQQGLPVTVTLTQNPPAVGDNTLDVLVSDANGKPVTGLKLMAAVAMTSMDMGTEHPKSVEGKDGHYTVPVKFSMKGPWRVTLMNDGKVDKSSAVQTILDFNVDGKTKWKMPTSRGTSPSTMPDMAMSDKSPDKKADTKKIEVSAASGGKTADVVAQNKPKTDSAPQKPETPAPVATTPAPAKTAADDKATGKTVVKTTEDMTPAKGVETAPDTTKPAGDKTTPAQTPGYQVMLNTPAKSLKVGKNMLDVTVLDPAGKPVIGAKITAAVEMTSMDMGVTRPKAKEDKAGHYVSEVTFSMKGPWRVTMTVTPPKQKPFTKALDFNVPK